MYGNQETILTTDDKAKPGDHLTNDPHRRPKPAPRALSPIQPPVVPRTETGPPPVVPRTETGGPPPVVPRTEMGVSACVCVNSANKHLTILTHVTNTHLCCV